MGNGSSSDRQKVIDQCNNNSSLTINSKLHAFEIMWYKDVLSNQILILDIHIQFSL